MGPKSLILIDTSEKRAAPDQNDTPNFHPSSTRDNGDHRPGPSNPSKPPSYARNIALKNPFPNGDGVQEGFQPSPAKKLDPTPTAAIVIPLPPVPSPDDDPFTVETVLDDSISALPPLPTRPPGLTRGLQIPSRISLISWGFSFPKILLEHGVTKPHWRRFKHELKKFAHLSFGQWAKVLVASHAVGTVFGQPAGIICHHQMQKRREHENFLQAYRSGLTKMFEDRWNDDYFHPLGLHIRVEPPDIGKTNSMDVASSKLFKYQQKKGTVSPAPGLASKQGDKKEYKYQSKEGRYRLKAIRKCRIIVLPYEPALPTRRTTGSQDRVGQIVGTTAVASASIQDFAHSTAKYTGSQDPDRTPALAQRLSWSHQGQASSSGLYSGSSEEMERTRSPARVATTHWGGNR